MTTRTSAGAPSRPAPRRASRIARAERMAAAAFLAPAVVFLCLVIVVPLGQAFWTSLHRIRGLRSSFVGVENYLRVLADEAFWSSLGVSVVFTASCVVAHLVLGLGLALLLNRIVIGRTLLRTAFLMPWIIAPAIGATIWLWMLEPQFGVLNHFMVSLGLASEPLAWLGEPTLALVSVIVVDIWRGIPFMMLLMLAGLQTIPKEQYEAARIDGATSVQLFRYITLPNLAYLILVGTTLDIINTIRHFDIIAVMTGGGPVSATEVLPVLLYNTAFRANRLGEAATIGILLLLIVLAFSIVYIRAMRLERTGERA